MKPRNPRPWKEEVKDLLSFHPGERRGLSVLLGLCILGAAWVTWEQWIRPATVPDKDLLEVTWRQWQDSLAEANNADARPEHTVQLFNFNPNGLSTEEWVLLGLSERQARSIHRYEEKGGSFRTKKDLARMRVVSPELFAQWQPYILLPDSFPTKAGEHPDNRRDHRDQDTTRWEQRPYAGSKARAGTTIRSVELNSADSAALVAVRGIGPAFAHAIIRYRERLGGYRSLDQLQEVYLLRDKPEAVERLREHLVVDPALVRRIDINRCEAKELAAHPYIGWNLAKALVAYRDRHGPYKQVADISGCALVTDSLRGRIEPYLSVGP